MIKKMGQVALVGAGPGDPRLITVKGMELLSAADVVIHDRLIENELLKYCRSDARIIDVGKYPDHHRINQFQINELIVRFAVAGHDVVRLKGGDPFVFGRGTEEVAACVNAGVSYEIVPGITSAIAGPSAAGIPVTSRGVARSFVVTTGQTDPNLPDDGHDFAALAGIDTVVFMMGRKNMRFLIDGLLSAGKSGETPVACIERASMKEEKICLGRLDTIVELVERRGLQNPMITIVGDVVALAKNEANGPEDLLMENSLIQQSARILASV